MASGGAVSPLTALDALGRPRHDYLTHQAPAEPSNRCDKQKRCGSALPRSRQSPRTQQEKCNQYDLHSRSTGQISRRESSEIQTVE